jgi:hypothetical protein
LYQNLKNKAETFVTSPITLANLLASFSTVANPETQQLFFSTLNSKAGMVELFDNIHYHNSTSSNVTRIVTSDTGLAEKVKELGTEVIVDPTGSMGH